QPAQAEQALRKAAALAPQDRVVRLNLALALWQQGGVAEARSALKELAGEYPDFASARYNLACLEAQAGRPAEALAALKEAIALEDRYRSLARKDPDLARLANDPAFLAVVGQE
ncbi:MAG: TPR end-of-group domain-containing protein, partial [Chitinophagales bacterium]